MNESDDVHLVKDENMKVKDKRRQMASTSVRNLASHIAAVAHANFIPVPEKWIPPKGMAKGVVLFIKLLKDVTGAHFKPVESTYLLNEDCSSQYYCSGT